MSMEDATVDFFKKKRGQVAIYDANVSKFGKEKPGQVVWLTFERTHDAQNGTRKLRREVKSKFESLGINVFFIGGCTLRALGT